MTASSSTSPEPAAAAGLAVPSGKPAVGRLVVPPSKSVTHRQLALALLAGRPLELVRPLLAEDTLLFFDVLRRLAWRVEERDRGGRIRLHPPASMPDAAAFSCGNAGTLLRFLVAVLAVAPGRWTLDGSARLRERPVGPLADALGRLGVAITWHGAAGFPPLTVHGGTLGGGEVAVDAGESSQYLSALLLAALAAPAPTRLVVDALTSHPYVEVTLDLIAQWGGVVEREAGAFTVRPGLVAPATASVEGDYSAAAYPAAAALLTSGEVRLGGLRRDSAQGDRALLDLLAEMGAGVRWEGDEVRVSGEGALRAVDADLAAMPDQVPTVAALAPFARGTTRIRNVPHLRIKESDRLAAMASELRRVGAEVEELPDGLVIPGRWADATPPSGHVTVESWGDHRIAMSMALVGLRRPGISVSRPEVVAKSYPSFWDDLTRLIGPPPQESG
jgi:3-phosphoshikimate 1-carboxyvinyltransferase